MNHSGICYDGPLEGKQVSHDHSYFIVPKYEGQTRLGGHTSPDDIKYYTYHWSHPLRKWVCK